MNKTLQQFAGTIDEINNLTDKAVAQLLEPIKEGKWSIREIVAHLYYWDKFNLEVMVSKMIDGGTLPAFPDHDQHNAEGISFVKGKSVELIIHDFVETRKRLIDEIAAIPSDARFIIGQGKRQFSAESFIKIFLKHDLHHLKQINEKLSIN